MSAPIRPRTADERPSQAAIPRLFSPNAAPVSAGSRSGGVCLFFPANRESRRFLMIGIAGNSRPGRHFHREFPPLTSPGTATIPDARLQERLRDAVALGDVEVVRVGADPGRAVIVGPRVPKDLADAQLAHGVTVERALLVANPINLRAGARRCPPVGRPRRMRAPKSVVQPHAARGQRRSTSRYYLQRSGVPRP